MSIDGMKTAFLQENAINESLGLCDLAGTLRDRGVVTRLFLGREEPRLADALRGFDPDLTVVPCDLLGHNAALRLARTAKASTRGPVILGGTHATFFPNVVLREGVDAAFAGEAEGVVVDILAAIREGRSFDAIPNMVLRDGANGHRENPLRELDADLDRMPMPDREIYYRYDFIARFPWKKFGTGRGCMNSCGYCFNPTYRAMVDGPGCFYRRKSPARIAAEINAVRARHPVGVVHFSDDLFNSGVTWLEDFAEIYRREVGVPFSANTYAKSITDDSIRMLKEAGCRVLAVGVEVGDDDLRRNVLNKPITNDDLARAVGYVKREGIRLVTFNILGLPWGSVEKDVETLALNIRFRADHARVSILTPFPKSAMTRRLIAERILAEDFEERIYEIDDLPQWPAESLFRQSEPVRTRRLLSLWHLMMALRLPFRSALSLVNSRWSSWLTPISTLIALANERKVFGIDLLSGFRYFLHVKSPALKTSNYVSFI